MQVHVEHRLSRCSAIGEQQIDALTAKTGDAHRLRHPSSHGHHRTPAGVVQASQIRHMMIGNDQHMSGGEWVGIHENRDAIITEHQAGLSLPGDNSTEYTSGIEGHRRSPGHERDGCNARHDLRVGDSTMRAIRTGLP